MVEEINAQLAIIAQPVQIWMNWMMLVFLASIIFVRKHMEARFTLGAFLLSAPVAAVVFMIWKNVHLFGVAHLVVWTPLLAYFVCKFRNSDEEKYQAWGAYKIWAILLMSTISVSLLFDIRDIYVVIEGTKAMH